MANSASVSSEITRSSQSATRINLQSIRIWIGCPPLFFSRSLTEEMWAEVIPVNSRSHPVNSTRKYAVTCQDRISKATPSTNDWLTIVGALKKPTQTRIQSVLEGILEKRKRVAVKLGASESIHKEYTIAQELHDIPGFIRPHCYFECEDSYKEFPSKDRTDLCKGHGTSMKVLVLPFLEEGSMRSRNWTKHLIVVLHACLMQFVCSLFQAYEQKGVLHNDTHLDNVLLKKTTTSEVVYTLGGNAVHVPTEGYLIEIMDFEMSMQEVSTNRGRAIGQVYYDVLHAVFDLLYHNDTTKIVGDKELVMALTTLKHDPVDFYTGWKILHPLILKLNVVPKVPQPVSYNPFVFG